MNKCITNERTKKITDNKKNLISKDKAIFDNSCALSDLLIDKCVTYRDNRKALTKATDTMGENPNARGGHVWQKQIPTDADGLYLIVEGKAKVVNKLYNYNYAGKKLSKNDFIGDSKFLKCQGFSYFGDIVACKNEAKVEVKAKISIRDKSKQESQPAASTKRATETKVESDQTDKEPEHTTCMFLPAYLLYLIPFYDLYDHSELQFNRIEFQKEDEASVDEKNDKIRDSDRSFVYLAKRKYHQDLDKRRIENE